ncbi:hypothetical protein OXX69_000731 [Metschnikowia pulcherrima]
MTSSLDIKALNVFIQTPVSQDMVHKLVVATLQVIQCQDDKSGKTAAGGKPLPSLMTFINRLVKYTNVYTGTLMATLVLLDRLKSKLPQNAQGLACTRHRVFLSCLILASKFHNDSSPKNVHWAKYTDGLFSLKDVNLMERQLLFLLNWNVKVSNDDMVTHLGKLLTPIKEDLVKAAKMRKFLYAQQQAAASRRYSPSTPANYDGLGHARQSSCSSVESMSPLLVQKGNRRNLEVHPHIEMTARAEEIELTRMLNQLGHKTQAQ